MKFGVNIFITFSKLMALLVLIIGSTFAFIFNSSEVIIFSLSLAGGLAGLKTWSEGLTRRKHISSGRNDQYDYNNQNDYYNYQRPKDEVG